MIAPLLHSNLDFLFGLHFVCFVFFSFCVWLEWGVHCTLRSIHQKKIEPIKPYFRLSAQRNDGVNFYVLFCVLLHTKAKMRKWNAMDKWTWYREFGLKVGKSRIEWTRKNRKLNGDEPNKNISCIKRLNWPEKLYKQCVIVRARARVCVCACNFKPKFLKTNGNDDGGLSIKIDTNKWRKMNILTH